VDYSISFIGDFWSIFLEALPFIVLGAVIAGFLEELVPQQFFAKVIPRNRFLAIALSGLLGLVFPMCECGIVPVMRRLLRKGLPLSCCVAYMLAGPIINLVVISSTYAAFAKHTDQAGRPVGYWIIGLRVGLGYLVAMGAAAVVEWQHRKHGDKLLKPVARPAPLKARDDGDDNGGNGAPPRTLMQRVGNITATALHDFVDITLFLILGALIAAGVNVLVNKDQIALLSNAYPVLAILLMMIMAIVLCLCSEADAFVAASFVTLHPAAKLAFLVLGPMLDFKLFLMYTRVFEFRLIWTIISATVIQVLLYSLITYYVWQLTYPFG
jgi:uncharacterized protein